MASFTALFDANVLYPFLLRDFLMQMAMTGLFRARWTDDIHEEWIGAVLRDRADLQREQLEAVRDLMSENAENCLVTRYEDLIPGLELPDPDDRHVLAAAIRTRAAVIVTKNLKDFPEEYLARFGIEAQHPDEFTTHLLDLSAPAVCQAARLCRARLKNPPRNKMQYLNWLEKQGLPRTVSSLRQLCGDL